MSNPEDETSRQEERKEKSRNRERQIDLAVKAAMILCLAGLIFSLIRLGGYYVGYAEAASEYEGLLENAKLVEAEGVELYEADLAGLKKENPDLTAWVQIPDTAINYPVMHTRNNSYYMNHTFYEEESKAGSIFMEAMNTTDFTDPNTILYGHNMKNGSMFAGLRKYRDPEYREEHPYVYIQQEDGMHTYEIFACYETEAGGDAYALVFPETGDFARWLDWIEGQTYDTGVEVTEEDLVLTLSTCTQKDEYRFVVQAKKIS